MDDCVRVGSVSHESLGESSVSRGLFGSWSDPGEYENAETMLRACAVRVSKARQMDR